MIAGWLASCHAPAVAVDPPDARDDGSADGAETATDTFVDARVCPTFRKDGDPCTGHDEDGDCIPDECDDCPGLANEDQIVGARAVGKECLHLEAPFAEATERFTFEDFTSMPTWQHVLQFPAEDFVVDGDELVGGIAGSSATPYLRNTRSALGRTIVVTTVFTMVETPGVVAVMLDVEAAPARLFACVVNGATFEPVYVGDTPRCGGAGCPFLPFFDDTGARVIANIPAKLKFAPGTRLGLRASLSSGAGGVTRELECRVFDPSSPTTLQISSGSSYSLRVKVPTVGWLGSSFALLASGTSVRFEHVDVLASPPP
jgi:hypothetical protein